MTGKSGGRRQSSSVVEDTFHDIDAMNSSFLIPELLAAPGESPLPWEVARYSSAEVADRYDLLEAASPPMPPTSCDHHADGYSSESSIEGMDWWRDHDALTGAFPPSPELAPCPPAVAPDVPAVQLPGVSGLCMQAERTVYVGDGVAPRLSLARSPPPRAVSGRGATPRLAPRAATKSRFKRPRTPWTPPPEKAIRTKTKTRPGVVIPQCRPTAFGRGTIRTEDDILDIVPIEALELPRTAFNTWEKQWGLRDKLTKREKDLLSAARRKVLARGYARDRRETVRMHKRAQMNKVQAA